MLLCCSLLPFPFDPCVYRSSSPFTIITKHKSDCNAKCYFFSVFRTLPVATVWQFKRYTSEWPSGGSSSHQNDATYERCAWCSMNSARWSLIFSSSVFFNSFSRIIWVAASNRICRRLRSLPNPFVIRIVWLFYLIAGYRSCSTHPYLCFQYVCAVLCAKYTDTHTPLESNL